MASCIRRLLFNKAPAAASCLRRPWISLSQNRGCSSKLSGDSTLRQVSSPWLMLPPSFEKQGGHMSYNFYSLAQNKVVSFKKKYSGGPAESPDDDASFAGSSHGWLALHNQRGDRDLFLSNPITGENIKLPPLSTTSSDNYRCSACFVRKVILSSPPHQPDCRAFMSFYGSMYACIPGRSTSWKLMIDWEEYEDFVYSTAKKVFLCLFQSDIVELWHAKKPLARMTELFGHRFDNFAYDEDDCSEQVLEHQRRRCRSFRTRHLIHVEHTGQLLLVKRYFAEQLAPDGSPIKHKKYESYGSPSKDFEHDIYPSKTIDFDVSVIDFDVSVKDHDSKKLRYMKDSLDGLALFVGINHSFAVRAADFPELKPDSIYFTECETYSCPTACPDDEMYTGHDIGIFDYKEKTISPCYYPSDYGSLRKIYPSPFWFIPSPH